MKWFVLFVKTGYEMKVSSYLERNLDDVTFSIFRPLIEYVFVQAGKSKIEVKAMFQGYVFIEVDTDSEELPQELLATSKRIASIHKVLYHDYTLAAVHDKDRVFLDSLLNEARVLEKSEGIIVGDKVIIHKGPLVGQESKIMKIDRHKRTAEICVNMFDGAVNKMTVPLEIISKT